MLLLKRTVTSFEKVVLLFSVSDVCRLLGLGRFLDVIADAESYALEPCKCRPLPTLDTLTLGISSCSLIPISSGRSTCTG
ncbi:hypothetical protein IWX46DRAFT_614872 [Phyllosticta citricarpa]|uniref:Uncharacterized protein n=1 Tax=Phyllosticta citricarpa TaxID=55181 RepID=A0ABR1L9C0_9PEZI